MRLKTLVILALCAALPVLGFAKDKKPKLKKGKAPVEETTIPQRKAPEPKEAEPVITDECLMNISLFQESVKNKQYQDAVEPWNQVYSTCPNANKAIYTSGQKILKWQLENASTDEEKAAIKEKIMKLFDDRIKYFGDDPKYPKAYILGLKALDYVELYPEDNVRLTAYPWIKESVTTLKEHSQIPMLDLLASVSNSVYKSDPEKYGEQYVEDYQMVIDYLTAISKDKTNKNSVYAKQYKDYIDNVFASSGAANCTKLDELCKTPVAENLNDIETLSKVITLYKKIGCTESDVYFTAAEAQHKLQPTEESAVGCARMCTKKKDYDGAIAYYEQAVQMAEDNFDKADYLYYIAVLYSTSASTYSKAREYARKALSYNDGMGKCYMLIGKLYASSKPYANDAKGRILNKTVFWAAVDKFQQAKQIDKMCTEEANQLIATYSRYFPTKEERFDLPQEFGSGSFTVGGWIGESTRVR